jgi:hypothetical protein
MTHDEMCAVIQAHKEGKQIQCCEIGRLCWYDCNPGWEFGDYIYRVKPAEPKKVKLLAWLDCDQLFWLRETASPKWPSVRVPSEDKEIEIPGE